MSIETWKQEFYPVPASEATSDVHTALDHSIRKWTGLLKKNLKKHGLTASWPRIWEGRKSFPITTDTCALCHLYHDACDLCPLGGCGPFSAFCIWAEIGDARPMLTKLKQARKNHA